VTRFSSIALVLFSGLSLAYAEGASLLPRKISSHDAWGARHTKWVTRSGKSVKTIRTENGEVQVHLGKWSVINRTLPRSSPNVGSYDVRELHNNETGKITVQRFDLPSLRFEATRDVSGGQLKLYRHEGELKGAVINEHGHEVRALDKAAMNKFLGSE
jgi:hypothetical protein